MLALRQSLRQTLRLTVRPSAVAVRPYSESKVQEEIKEDKEGWTENREDTESEAAVTADNSDAPHKPDEKLVEETINKLDGIHHGGKGELKGKK